MIFSSFEFLVFFSVVYALFLLLRNRGRIFYIFLLIASYYFYMSWNPAFILLIVFSTALDYFLGPRLYKRGESN